MNKHNTLLATILVTLFGSSLALAHDPSMHKGNNEKPNCEAMQKMDHTQMNTDDPVMQAMMEKCKISNEEESEAGHSDSANTESQAPDINARPVRRKIGHEAPMNPDAPPHEQAYHQKVYEVPDCENMSNMHHSPTTDKFDPIIQEMMKRCEDADTPKNAATNVAAETKQEEHADEHD